MAEAAAPPAPRGLPVARVLCVVLGPVPTAVLTFAMTLTIFGVPHPALAVPAAACVGTALGVVLAVRALRGPGSIARRETLVLVLAGEVVCFAVLWWTDAPPTVAMGFVQLVLAGTTALVAPFLRLWGHGFVLGALVGVGRMLDLAPVLVWQIASVAVIAVAFSHLALGKQPPGRAIISPLLGFVAGGVGGMGGLIVGMILWGAG